MTIRRGMCPGLVDPMPTGDGLLARLAVAHPMPLESVAALCVAARAYGNGIIEITSRGSVQVRGLTPMSAPDFSDAVAALDIADPAGGRVRASPLAGLDAHETFDVTAVADRLREVLVGSGIAAKVAPKISIVVDGGGVLHLDAVPCDIRLRAERTGGALRFRVTVANESATTFDTITPENAIEAVMELLCAIAALGPTARARDLPHPTSFPRQAQGERKRIDSPAQPIGTHRLRDGSVALGIGLPFGHCDSDTLQTLIDEAHRAEAASARPAPARVLLLIGVPPAHTSGLIAKAERLGFITRPDDPRRRVLACAGAPACAAAEIPTRTLASAIAAAARLEMSTIHLSGCAKGCAHPGSAALTVVGIGGKCGIVPNGRAQDAPVEFIMPEDLLEFLARRAVTREMAHG
jgi:precorrin-3B synthase